MEPRVESMLMILTDLIQSKAASEVYRFQRMDYTTDLLRVVLFPLSMDPTVKVSQAIACDGILLGLALTLQYKCLRKGNIAPCYQTSASKTRVSMFPHADKTCWFGEL